MRNWGLDIAPNSGSRGEHLITDKYGREISARSRQMYGTLKDIVDFFQSVAEALPDTKFYDGEQPDLRWTNQISLSEWANLDDWCATRIDLLFNEDASSLCLMSPDTRSDGEPVANCCRTPTMSFRGGGLFRQVIVEIGRPLYHARKGALISNNLADDPTGKRIVDRVFRLHRNMFAKKARWVDLISRRTVRLEKRNNWYGPDLARLCHEQRETYLDISINPYKQQFLGLLPAD